MTDENQFGACRRSVLRRGLGAAVGTGILGTSFSGRGVGGKQSEDDGSGISTDGGPIQIDPGQSGWPTISNSAWVEWVEDHLSWGLTYDLTNPHTFGFDVCYEGPDGIEVCKSDTSKLQKRNPACTPGTVYSYNFDYTEFVPDPVTGGKVQNVALSGWLGIDTTNWCYYAGTNDSCEKLTCPDWPPDADSLPYDAPELMPIWEDLQQAYKSYLLGIGATSTAFATGYTVGQLASGVGAGGGRLVFISARGRTAD